MNSNVPSTLWKVVTEDFSFKVTEKYTERKQKDKQKLCVAYK